MKKKEVKIGGLYYANVSGKSVIVRIDSAHSRRGWNATNTATGRPVRILSAERLRGPAKAAKTESEKRIPAKAKAVAERDKRKKAQGRSLSAIEAAAIILAASDEPLTTKEIISEAARRRLWQSPNGKTPHATLHSAMMREIKQKGDQSRFRKVARGKFAHA